MPLARLVGFEKSALKTNGADGGRGRLHPGNAAAGRSSDPAAGVDASLHRTWAFRLAMLTWVASVTKALGVALHGLVGMFPLLAVAVVVAGFEGSIKTVLNNVIRNGSRNFFMVVLVVWYGFGVFSKMYLWGAAETDWRGVMGPLLLALALVMGFGFMHEDQCARIFQITFIAALGVQSGFAGRVMVEDPTLSRAAWAEMQGGWSYGDQAGFALQAILLPVLVWRGLVEPGALRWALLAGCAAISFSVIVCNFATAILLLAFSIPAAALLGLAFARRRGGSVRVLVVAFSLLLVGAGVSWWLRGTPILASTVQRIERLWEDPTSGGYSQREAQTWSRWTLAKQSFDTFCQHPFIGGGSGGIRSAEADKVVGRHSSLFDMLGFYGLLGGGGAFVGLVLLMLLRALQNLRRQRNWESVVVATSVILFLIAGVTNPYWDGLITMVLLVTRLFRMEGERR